MRTLQAHGALIAVGLFVVAATLLIAALPFFAEKDSSQDTVPSLNLVAQLTRATGPVQFLASRRNRLERSSARSQKVVRGWFTSKDKYGCAV